MGPSFNFPFKTQKRWFLMQFLFTYFASIGRVPGVNVVNPERN
jgi:hypothetical protein